MSINKKQKTLFESWKCTSIEPSCSEKETNEKSCSGLNKKLASPYQTQSSVIDLCDDLNDVDLLSAAVAVEQSHEKHGVQPSMSARNGMQCFVLCWCIVLYYLYLLINGSQKLQYKLLFLRSVSFNLAFCLFCTTFSCIVIANSTFFSLQLSFTL